MRKHHNKSIKSFISLQRDKLVSTKQMCEPQTCRKVVKSRKVCAQSVKLCRNIIKFVNLYYTFVLTTIIVVSYLENEVNDRRSWKIVNLEIVNQPHISLSINICMFQTPKGKKMVIIAHEPNNSGTVKIRKLLEYLGQSVEYCMSRVNQFEL